MFKIEPGNETLTDGRTDRRTDGRTDGHSNANFFGGYNIIPRTFFKWRGIKMFKQYLFVIHETLNYLKKRLSNSVIKHSKIIVHDCQNQLALQR